MAAWRLRRASAKPPAILSAPPSCEALLFGVGKGFLPTGLFAGGVGTDLPPFIPFGAGRLAGGGGGGGGGGGACAVISSTYADGTHP
jgi:hypothetical protein